jgi:hypothetical protein
VIPPRTNSMTTETLTTGLVIPPGTTSMTTEVSIQ